MEGQGLLEIALGAMGAALLSAFNLLESYWWLPAVALVVSLVWGVTWKYCQWKRNNA